MLKIPRSSTVADVGNRPLPTCDLVSLSGMLRNFNMDMVPLNVDDPRGIVETKPMGQSLACTIEVAFPFRGRVTVEPDRCLIGYAHRAREGSWCQGLPLTTGSAFVLFPNDTAELLFAADSRLTMLGVPHAQMQDTLRHLTRCSMGALPALHPLCQPHHPSAMERLSRLYGAISGSSSEDSAGLPAPDLSDTASAWAQNVLTAHLAANLSASSQDLPKESRRVRRHFLVVQRTEQFMRSHLRNDIYVREMCAAAGVSERSLRYAFDALLGISPNRYLAMLRLCTACRNLAASGVSRRSVKSVALSCGLWDLSRFADSYRKVFGELPHSTLMRSPTTAPC